MYSSKNIHITFSTKKFYNHRRKFTLMFLTEETTKNMSLFWKTIYIQ